MKGFKLSLIFLAALCGYLFLFQFTFRQVSLLKSWHQFSASQEENEELFVDRLVHLIAKNEQVWPGYDLSSHPLLIAFDSGHLYAFNFEQLSDRWQRQQKEGISYHVSFKPFDQLDLIQLHDNYPVEGQQAFVYHVDLEEEKEEPFCSNQLCLLIERHFRCFQKQRFVRETNLSKKYLDSFNQKNLSLMMIEDMLLSDFFHASLDQAKSVRHKLQHVYDYLALAQTRAKIIASSSWTKELHTQRFDGVATYVALKTQGLSSDSINMLMEKLQAPAINEDILDRCIFWRHRIVGAAICLALDMVGKKGWMEAVEAGANPLEILQQELYMPSEEVALCNEKSMSRYGYEPVNSRIGQALSNYREESLQLKERFFSQEGVTIHLRLTPGSTLHKQQTMFSCYYCEDGSKLTLIDNSCRFGKNNIWRLVFKGQPFVVKESEGGYLFKCPQICRLKIDEKPIALYEFMQISDKTTIFFTTIELESPHCNFQSFEQPGKIEIKKTELFITFDHKE